MKYKLKSKEPLWTYEIETDVPREEWEDELLEGVTIEDE